MSAGLSLCPLLRIVCTSLVLCPSLALSDQSSVSASDRTLATMSFDIGIEYSQ